MNDALPTKHRLLTFRKKQVWLLAILILAITIASSLAAMRIAEHELRQVSAERALIRRDDIAARIDRLRHLTTAIAGHPDVRRLFGQFALAVGEHDPLAMPDSNDLSQGVNDYLDQLARASGASLLYVIDRSGITRASSNHDTAVSLVGREFTYRPYFQQAIEGREARYYGVGTATGVAGYFFALPVFAELQVIGIAVVKIDLDALQRSWQQLDENLLLLDEHGVSIAANPAHWRFRTTVDIDEGTLMLIREQRKYAGEGLTRLSATAFQYLEGLNDPEGFEAASNVAIDGNNYLVSSLSLPAQNWLLVHLSSDELISFAGVRAAIASLVVSGLSVIATLYWRERQRRNALSRVAEEAARMRALNAQLAEEIQERRRAEVERNKAQVELIHASKMAALGQMSAAVAHEVNQPLSAIRTYCASARLLLEQ